MRNLYGYKKVLTRFSVTFITTALVLGCGGGGAGGGLFAYDTPVITPIDGNWIGDSGISLNFDESFSSNRYVNRDYGLSAKLNDAEPVTCGTESTTRFDAKYKSGLVEFYSEDLNSLDDIDSPLCLVGEFKDLATLSIKTVDGEIFDTFRNDRVAVRMEFGGWRSNSGEIEMIFNDPSTVDNDSGREVDGCVRLSETEIVPVFGTMLGLNTNTRYPPSIEPLFRSDSGETIYRSIMYRDVFTLSVTSADGQELVFERSENVEFDCPES